MTAELLIQSRRFLDGAADDYYRRNKNDFGKTDPVVPLIEKVGLRPCRALEVGCANGWRLKRMQEKYGCEVWGIDPSEIAISDARRSFANGMAHFEQGTADVLPYGDSDFDTVIVGFCMWFIEPWQWFKVAAEVDRVLKIGGALIIHDFAPAYPIKWENWSEAFGSELEKTTTAWLYDYPKLWLGHPWYSYVEKEVSAKGIGNLFILEAATALRKSYTQFVVLGRKG